MFDSNLFREAVKKKYDIQQQEANIKQQEANTGQADQLARAPLYQGQAQHYAGANETELNKTRINAAEEQRKTLAMAPLWQAEAGSRNEATKGLAMQNKLESELYGDTFNTARSSLASKRMLGIGEQQAYGQSVNRKIAERNSITGESNPLISTFEGGNPVFENIDKGPAPLSARDVSDLSAEASGDALAMESPYTPEAQERIKRRLAISKTSGNTPYGSEYNMW